MMMTEEGLTRLKALENQAFYLFTLLDEIQEQEEVLEQEYKYLDNASEIFDTILYGAGCFEEEYLHDNSMNLNDYYILFKYAKNILGQDVNNPIELKKELDSYRNIIFKIKSDRNTPQVGPENLIYNKAKTFFQKYHEVLLNSIDYASVDM